jgi:DNA (cytosine-5)-methyltransferase 1
MKYISLFSGIGGFDFALERLGFICDTVCEIDKQAQTVLRRHFPHARLIDDVRKVGKESHERKSVDLICGGFPCQDVSIAGERAGLAGKRSGLWFEFARIIDELEPQWLVIENVPGLLSSNHGRDFAEIIQWLVKRGYGVCWRVLDAQYFGVPQRRRRVFIVASFGNGRSAEVLFEREGSAGYFDQGGTKEKDIARPLTASPSASGRYDASNETFLPVVADTITSMYSRNRGASAGNSSKTHNLFAIGALQAHSKAHGHAMTTQQAAESGQMIVGSLHNGTPGRDASDAGNGHLVGGVRRLTPLECERLQGFPDGWTDGQSDSARYRQLGNAVAVPVVSWLAERIRAQTCPTPREPDKWESAVKAGLSLPAHLSV